MRQLARLLAYVRPYWLQVLASVVLMAAVGLLDAFRVLLIGPIFDKVLNPSSPTSTIALPRFPGSQRIVYLQQLLPSNLHIHNAFNVVATSLVAATVIKGLCDYLGTYLVNYAGLGLTTDLRSTLYN